MRNAIDHDIHAAVHTGAQARVGMLNAGQGQETADGGKLVQTGFGQRGDLADIGLERQFRQGVDADYHVLRCGDASAFGLFDAAGQFQAVEVGNVPEIHAGIDAIADFVGDRVGGSDGVLVVQAETEETTHGGFDLHLGDARFLEFHVGLGLVAKTRERRQFGLVGGGMEGHGGLFHFQLLLGYTEVDFGFCALDLALDTLQVGLQLGVLDGEAGVG